MQKCCFIILSGLLALSSLSAQDNLRFGLAGHFGYSFFSGSGYSDYLDQIRQDAGASDVSNNALIGLTIGPSVEYMFHPLFSLQGELLFSGTGGAYVLDTSGDSHIHLLSSVELQMPLLLKVRRDFGSRGKTVYLMAGPRISVLLAQTEWEQTDAEYVKISRSREGFNTLGLGAVGALGWEFPLQKVNMQVELRYSRSFTSALSAYDGSYENCISLGTGFKWGGRS